MNFLHRNGFARARALAPRLAAAAALTLLASTTALAQDATALKARHTELHERLTNNAFGRPLYIESAQTSSDLKGDIYALADYPFGTVQQALTSPDHWCDILILHLNVKACRSNSSGASSKLALVAGKKYDQPVDEAYKLEFNYRVAASTAEYLQVQLNADEGPMGTRDYRIRLEAIPLDARHSFIHMSYAYGFGFAAKLAMQTYLATVGRDKVGFSPSDEKVDGKPAYIDGVLGLVERNTMRYYLAIDAFLSAYHLPASEQVEKRIRTWFTATERYPRQLHEMDEAAYLNMKREEIRRQKADEAPRKPAPNGADVPPARYGPNS